MVLGLSINKHNMRTLEAIISDINKDAEQRIANAKHDYAQGQADCKMGIYDKWYRYHRHDDGDAYNSGWYYQNQITQCERVTFLDGE